MKKYFKFVLVLFVTFSISVTGNSKDIPSSFADLAERVMPSVVNISTTTTVTTQANPFPFEFPPGSPFEDMFKEFGTPQKRKSSALGSGFIIDEKGIVITNNHVIQGAEDIVVRVNGDKEFKAKVLGADPGMDIAVLQIETDEKFIPVKFGDSVFMSFKLTELDGTPITGRRALILTIELAKEAGELATRFLKKPHDLEYEKTFMPFALMSKKRYMGMLYEEDPDKCKCKIILGL